MTYSAGAADPSGRPQVWQSFGHRLSCTCASPAGPRWSRVDPSVFSDATAITGLLIAWRTGHQVPPAH